MTAKHTKGDWWADGLEVGNDAVMSVKVAKVGGATYEEALANAKLIAASPRLLKALEALLTMPEYDGSATTSKARRAAKREAKEAIARAKGESK